MARTDDAARRVLLEGLSLAFDKRSWHGPNLMSSLRGVHAKQARRRFGRRKTIWEQLLHAAYWKHVVIVKLSGPTRFPRKGSNWIAMPADESDSAWKADLKLIHELQTRLLDAAAQARLDQKTIWLLQGAASHDIYHAGQIKLLRRLL